MLTMMISLQCQICFVGKKSRLMVMSTKRKPNNSYVSCAPLMKQIKALSKYKGEQRNVVAINCFYMGIASGVIIFTSCAHMHPLHRVNDLIK